jgi:hypothetical protein
MIKHGDGKVTFEKGDGIPLCINLRGPDGNNRNYSGVHVIDVEAGYVKVGATAEKDYQRLGEDAEEVQFWTTHAKLESTRAQS